MPLPPTVRSCRCGRLLDSFGQHRAACARAGVLDIRGCALESAAARICREAGGRVTTNVLVRELDLIGIHPADGRRLEVVAVGLLLHAGVQLASDTTLVGALRGDGTARSCSDGRSRFGRCSKEEGAQVSRVGGAWSQITPRGSCGRWSAETTGFLGALAKAKWCSALVAQEGRVVMAPPMGIDFVMRGSACCGIFLVGTPTCVQC